MKAFSWSVFGILVAAAVLHPADATAQTTTPGTDIYLAPLYMDQRTGVLEVGRPKNITDRPGYDNQPYFTLEGTGILFTSIREWVKEVEEEGDEVDTVLQADIFRYDLDSERVVQITRTADSEYSPTPLPFGTGFSVVVVEADTTQRLWEFSADGKGASMVLESIKPVGYHAWGDRFTVALFVLGEPHSLQLADIRTGRATFIAEDIGRSLHKIPGSRSVSFLHRSGDTWWIKELDLGHNRIQPVVKALPESQDYTWTPDGSILMAQNSSIYRWPPLKGSDWEKIAEFLDPDLQKISRLAVSPDGEWLALVAAEPIGIIED